MRAAAKGLAFISGVMFHFVRLLRRRGELREHLYQGRFRACNMSRRQIATFFHGNIYPAVLLAFLQATIPALKGYGTVEPWQISDPTLV